MNKKIYQAPGLRATRILTEALVANSLTVDTGTETGTQYTKQDRTQRDGYNVWNDDWSK